MQDTTSQQKHPALYSQDLKTSSQTYFFDIKAAKNGNKYLTITQSRIKDGQKFRNSIIVFSNDWTNFNQTVTEIQDKAK